MSKLSMSVSFSSVVFFKLILLVVVVLFVCLFTLKFSALSKKYEKCPVDRLIDQA